MLKSKIASLALAGLMTIGATGTTVFAAEPTAPVQPSLSISFDKEARAENLGANKVDASGTLKSQKGSKLAQMKANKEAKVSARGEKMANRGSKMATIKANKQA